MRWNDIARTDRAGRREEAIAAFEAALAQTPSSGWALWGLSETRHAAGDDASTAWAAFERIWLGDTAIADPGRALISQNETGPADDQRPGGSLRWSVRAKRLGASSDKTNSRSMIFQHFRGRSGPGSSYGRNPFRTESVSSK